MKNLIKTIQNTAFQNSLWTKGSKVILGVSGGPDSVCLLDVMSKIAKKADLEMIIAHVNYNLRGKDSERDEKLVKDLAEKYGLLAYILQPKIGQDKSENKLRDIRYAFFEQVRKENNFDAIAVAHNADDQVETFLMRVIRGAGLQGLSAMKYKSEKIIRPILNIYRLEILAYLKKQNLKYRTDKTNLQDLFLRNKIRNKLIPYLEKNFNPQIRQVISDATNSVAEDHALLNTFAEELVGTKKEFSAKEIIALHPALQRRVLLLYIRRARADLKNISAAHIEEALKILRSTKSKRQIVVFKGLKMTRKGDKVAIDKI